MATLRKFPYPYKSMIGVQSDVDHTNYSEITEILTFLNTEETNSIGKGIGLPLTTSVIAVSDLSTVAIFSHTSDKTGITPVVQTVEGKDWATQTLLDYIDKGWIDFLHSMAASGNDAYASVGWQPFGRSWAQAYLDWVNTHGRKLEYNINHSSSTSNVLSISDDNSNPGSSLYWVDLGIQAGIRFFEIGKSGAGRSYSQFNKTDSIIYPVTFQDGSKSWGFNRVYVSTPAANNVHLWCNQSKLDEIAANGVMDIVGVHWGYWHDGGYITNPEPKIPQVTIDALRLLRSYHDSGKILVSKTRDILQYDLAKRVTKWSSSVVNGKNTIDISSFDDTQFGAHIPTVDEVRGLTFYVDDAQAAEIRIAGTLVSETEIVRNEADYTGQESVGIKYYNFTPPPNYIVEDVPSEFIYIQTINGLAKVPVYSPYGRKLRTMTPNGIRGINLIEPNALNSSGIFINTEDGIKTLAKQ